MDAFEKWADDCGETDEKYYAIPVGSVGRAVAREAFRAGMRAAAEIVAQHAIAIAQHIKPYMPISEANVELLLEDCTEAAADIRNAIIAEADKP